MGSGPWWDVGERRNGGVALLELDAGERDCPVCGLGDSFASPRAYDVCRRCGWVDDPDAYAEPGRRSATNDESLEDARGSWPRRLAARLRDAPLSTLDIVALDGPAGEFEYVIDGVRMRDLYPAARGLKAALGPWRTRRDPAAALRAGAPETPTKRTRLYVCALCGGDDYEESLTADVTSSGDRVIWSRLGSERYVDEEPERWRLDVRAGPDGFAFDAEAYRRTLSDPRFGSAAVRST
ncbi:MAG TPA: CPCC family cysteine-rich protein [Candidatus Baltobacteraceae bacterium]|nr:CPCC family cysteine-rich protein [Candidatus Baltobacteraceae bacterium]